tara:strand:+ start:3860 stop:4576 length:717 start_codon:yes stop_codon:yes gene_type:complete
MKKAIITYNFGAYEEMPDILWKQENWDMFCFTDNAENKHITIPKDWHKLVLKSTDKIPHINDNLKQSKRLSNYAKFQPFKLLKEAVGEYDLIVVADANFQLSNDLDEACERLLLATSDACFMSHPNIKSCYEDIDLAVKLGKVDSEVAEFSKKMFREASALEVDENYCQTGFSIRRNTSGWKHFEHIWWEAYMQLCSRDQPVFNALLSKFPVLDLTIVPKAEIDPYMKYTNHSFEEIT